jgi:hypothetical protein
VTCASTCTAQNLNGFKPAEGVSLTLHMGVGVGPMSGFYVGGCGNKWCASAAATARPSAAAPSRLHPSALSCGASSHLPPPGSTL